ncbi:hypothetical protein K3495_g8031 [Podosphaera aphanis]|nr:hypothetical protein K3495_g8031 [Podosphaera aphanis]
MIIGFCYFMDLAAKAEIPRTALSIAFSVMIKGMALEFFYSSCQRFDLTINQLIQKFQDHFGEEHRRNILREWNKISLRSMLQKYPGKEKGLTFNEMVQNLHAIQRGLDRESQSDSAIRNRVISACSNIPACGAAILQKTSSISALCNNIFTALENNEAALKPEISNPLIAKYLTDRNFHANHIVQKQSHVESHVESRVNSKNKRCFAYILEQDNSSDNHDNQPLDIESMVLEIDQYKIKNEEYTSDPTSFFTSLSKVTIKDAKSHYEKTTNISTFHALTKTVHLSEKFVVDRRYSSEKFHGILLDTGASYSSTTGYPQAQAHMTEFNAKIDTNNAENLLAHFGVGESRSIGSMDVESPIGSIKFYVVEVNTPFLLCLQDMDKLGVYPNNMTDTIESPNKSILIIRKFGHPFLVWGYESMNHLSEVELRQLHRRFGHPSVNRLICTRERARRDDPTHYALLKKINKFCSLCQKYSRSPSRFKFVLKDDLIFNHSVTVDVMYIDNQPILHVIDDSTSFQAARWLQNMTAAHT